jgi:hypothetical protein
MATKINLTWDYLGWKNSNPTLDPHTAQFDWNSTLFTIVNILKNKVFELTENIEKDFDTLIMHPMVHDHIIQDMLFYRTKGDNKYLGHRKIVIDSELNNNEIILSSKKYAGFDGLIQIENYTND